MTHLYMQNYGGFVINKHVSKKNMKTKPIWKEELISIFLIDTCYQKGDYDN